MFSKKVRRGILFTLFVEMLVICSCEDTQSPKVIEQPIEGNVFFGFAESSNDTSSPPKIFLYMRTEKLYPVSGYEIIADYGEGNNNIQVLLYGVRFVAGGWLGSSPAYWSEEVRTGIGSHWLDFDNQMRQIIFRIQITDTSILIQDTSTNFMVPDYLTYWRYPVNSFVYHFSSADSINNWLYNVFLDTLLSHVNLQEFQFLDFGMNPFPKMYINAGTLAPSKFFKYQTDMDFYKCREVIRNFRENVLVQYPGVIIEFYDWKGRLYF